MGDRVAGRKAFVTGAAQGLGAAIARKLAAEGADLALTDFNPAALRETAEAIRAAHPERVVVHYEQDVRSEARWRETLSDAAAAMGGLDILVNNAGVGTLGTVESTSLSEWRRVMDTDVDSVFLGCKYALPLMRETGRMGSIVNISSIAGLIASQNYAAYNAAKAAVWLLTKSVALDGARMTPQIRCNSVHPSFIDTPILDGIAVMTGRADTRERLAKQIPLGRLGEPDDVAYATLYLASDESKFVTGAEFKIDGGISAH